MEEIRSVEELERVIRTEDMDEKIEAVKELYKYWEVGEYEGEFAWYFDFAEKVGIETIEKSVIRKAWRDEIEEAMYKGIYEVYKDKLREKLEDMSTFELARVLVSPKTRAERELALDLFKDKVEDAKALVRAIEIVEAEERIKQIGRVPVSKAGYLSDKQIELISEPSRAYAKDAFRKGLWKEEWGEPEKYGISFDTEVFYVEKPSNTGFIRLATSRGVWLSEWGEKLKF